MWHGLWTEATRHATDLDNALVTYRKNEASYNSFYQSELPGVRNLHQFGEVAIVHHKQQIRGKLEDRGKPALYLGRAIDHGKDVGRFLNLGTLKIILSRDATWMNQVYGDWKGLRAPTDATDDDGDEEEYTTHFGPQVEVLMPPEAADAEAIGGEDDGAGDDGATAEDATPTPSNTRDEAPGYIF